MKVVCRFNDPSSVTSNIPNNFDYGLELDKEYIVMGLAVFKKSNHLYYLIDEKGRPSWFPHQIFSMSNNKVSSNWFVKINTDKSDSDYYNLIGFKELCCDEDFFNDLLLREEEAMRTYFKRKIEEEKTIEQD